jgi:hypothetical protein
MKYTVTGRFAEFGVGQQLRLAAGQIDARRHALEIIDKAKGSVSAIALLYFKQGEEVDLAVKPEDLPRHLATSLTPSSKVPAEQKQQRTAPKKPDAASATNDVADDLDALEARLDAAEKAYAEALQKHGLPDDRDLTDEERGHVVSEADELAAAKAAYDEAVGA